MPGEPLMCVWEAAFVQNPQTTDKQLTKKGLNDVVNLLDDISCILYSKSKFDDFFKGNGDINIDSFRKYLFEILAEKGSPQCMVQEKVENKCWEISKTFYRSQRLKVSVVKKLWEICNRLAEVNSFPPEISSEVAEWLADKVSTHLGKHWKNMSRRQTKAYTFVSLLDRLTDDFFSEEPEESVCSCVNELYSWLVLEVMKSGWLFKRTRKQANWTNWIKRWFVLNSTRLSYYDNAAEGSRKIRGQIFVTGAKVETMDPFKGVFHKLHGRFKVSNLPYTEIEMATVAEEPSQRRSWISSIEEVINASKNKTTPIQLLLKERWGSATEDISSKLDKTELQTADAVSAIHQETMVQARKQPSQNIGGHKLSQASSMTNNQEESFDNSEEASLIKESTEKIKAVFFKIDTDGNGKIDANEFREFIFRLGLKINDREINLLYNSITKNSAEYITFQEFSDYFANFLLDETVESEIEAKLRGAFLAAERNGTGTLNFKDYAEYLWDRKRSIRMSKLITAFDEMDVDQKGQVSYDQFRGFYKNRMSAIPEFSEQSQTHMDEGLNAVDTKLREFYDKTEVNEIAQFIRDRWNKFASFKRYGASGQLAMTGGHGIVEDIIPGEYSLLELACFSDLPALVPKHTTVKGVTWESSKSKGVSGKLIFPEDFDGVLLKETATTQYLRYYGCSFAEGNQIKVSLLYRHAIQDFTYQNQYLEDYVALSNGGCGLEKHEFSHLDCPLQEDSGTFILGKFVGSDELHLTGFSIPTQHTLYIPGDVLHSNDYLKGTWRTMLSDEADIDHVHLLRVTAPNQLEHFKFEFAG